MGILHLFDALVVGVADRKGQHAGEATKAAARPTPSPTNWAVLQSSSRPIW